MKFTLLTNVTDRANDCGHQQGNLVILGAGEVVSVDEKSWNDRKDYVFIDAPGHGSPLRVHKSILKPV